MSYVCFETQLFGLSDNHPSEVLDRAKKAIREEFGLKRIHQIGDINVHLVECSGNWEGLSFENA